MSAFWANPQISILVDVFGVAFWAVGIGGHDAPFEARQLRKSKTSFYEVPSVKASKAGGTRGDGFIRFWEGLLLICMNRGTPFSSISDSFSL